RWGRHWLDLVRFAETLGHEFDIDLPEAYVYRDYVIRAFNDDVPYDQFVREHIAGDLLPKPRRHPTERFNESILGTGFWFLGEARHSPVDVRADQADHIDNQLDVFGKTFLGLTIACARCHDHKFDAISTRDYYALAGYLESSRPQRAFIDDPEPRREALWQLRDLRAQSGALAVSLSAKVLSEQAERLAQVLLNGRLRREDIAERIKTQATRPAERDPRYVVFEDFDKPDYQDWFVTGEAFGHGPSHPSDVLLQPKHVSPVQTVVGPGVAHSGLLAPRLQGVLRSRTFVIDHNKVLYRVAGHGGRINLIIDGYQLIREPIYGGLTLA